MKQAYWREFCTSIILPSTAERINLCLLQSLYIWTCFFLSILESGDMGHSFRQTALYKHSCPAWNLQWLSLQNTSTLMSLTSFPEPPKYGPKESRAQSFSLSLITSSLVFFFFSCKIGIIISTISNSQDCVSVKQNDASDSTSQTTNVVLLYRCEYYDVGVLIHTALFHVILQLDHNVLCSFLSLNWGLCESPAQWGGEQTLRPDCLGSGSALALEAVVRIKWAPGVKPLDRA